MLRFLLVATLLLSSCASLRTRDDMRGFATWYGREFQGRPTASGERFDLHAMTAAHRILAFGTRIRVTDVVSKKHVDVRINDRGPYTRDAIIDLSYEAARELGLIRAGRLQVQLEKL